MLIRTVDLLEFLRSKDYYRLLDFPVLDVPFEDTTWGNDTTGVALDLYENTEWTSLRDIEPLWSRQPGGAALWRELAAWARASGRLVSQE